MHGVGPHAIRALAAQVEVPRAARQRRAGCLMSSAPQHVGRERLVVEVLAPQHSIASEVRLGCPLNSHLGLIADHADLVARAMDVGWIMRWECLAARSEQSADKRHPRANIDGRAQG